MIGLIFGESYFPIQILKKIKQRRLKYLVIDLTKGKNLKRINIHTMFPLVNLARLLKYLRKINAKKYYLLEKFISQIFQNLN